MDQIIDGVRYNTETAHRIAHGGPPDGFAGWEMYQTPGGAFFMVLTDYDGESQRIEPYKGAAALAFLANHADFPEPLVVDWEQDEDEDEERRFTIRIPRRLANRVERAAKERNLSFNSYAMRCFEQCVVGERRVARWAAGQHAGATNTGK